MGADVDQDAVLRARSVLLGSGRPTPREEVEACRVLAPVSPATYLPRLARALVRLGHGDVFDELPEARLALFEEAAEAAYALDASDPMRTEVLLTALDALQHHLFVLGRRPEGLALREEMAGHARGALEEGPGGRAWSALALWARALAEEGRHREAAALHEEIVRHARPYGTQSGGAAWAVLEWLAETEAAGLRERATEAARELVERERSDLAARGTTRSLLLFALLRYAELLDGYGESGAASAAFDEAGDILAGLATSGDGSAGAYLYPYWAVLFGLSGRARERPAPERPAPAFGAEIGRSTPDVREHYFAGLPALRAAVEVPATDAELAERVQAHRRLTVRSALHAVHRRGYLFLEPVLPLFEEGVALARRLYALDPRDGVAPLARALFDRASALAAGRRFAEAHADFREALALRAARR
jgi:tetratricopeptide (TPR) repeat protein